MTLDGVCSSKYRYYVVSFYHTLPFCKFAQKQERIYYREKIVTFQISDIRLKPKCISIL